MKFSANGCQPGERNNRGWEKTMKSMLKAVAASALALWVASGHAQNADSSQITSAGVPTVNGVWNANAAATAFGAGATNVITVNNDAYETAAAGTQTISSAETTAVAADNLANSSSSTASAAYGYASTANSWSADAAGTAGNAYNVAAGAQNSASNAYNVAASAASAPATPSNYVTGVGVPSECGNIEPGFSWTTSQVFTIPGYPYPVYGGGGFNGGWDNTGENCGEG
jgi:hypothetical protein